MRTWVVAALALVAAAPFAAALPMSLAITNPAIEAVIGTNGEFPEVTRYVGMQHDCGAKGQIQLKVAAPAELRALTYPPDAVAMRGCTSAGADRVETPAAIAVKPLATTPSGEYRGTLTATMPDGQSATAEFTVRIPYAGTVVFQGPKTTSVKPGETVSRTFNLTLTSNGPTRVDLAIAAPAGWAADAPVAVEATRAGTAQRLPWTVTLVAPPDARGDTRITFTATARSTTTDAAAPPVTYDWYARVPVAPVDTTLDGSVRAAEEDAGTPAWMWGVGLVVGGALAFWWSRR